MNLTRAVTRENVIKRLFVQFCVLLVALGGIFPLWPSQAKAAAFEINDVDTYVIANSLKAIYQIDGHNPGGLNPKASLGIDSTLGIGNGLAISLTENAFYGYSASGGIHRLYRISPTGAANQVATLLGPAANAVISKDNKYYYIYNANGAAHLAYYDLSTKQHSNKVITNMTGGNGGDILLDGNGYIWFLDFGTRVNAYQIDPATATVLRTVPMTSLDGSTIDPGPRALSFLPNGKMYVGAGDTNTTVYELDPDTLSYRFLSSTNMELTVDAASRVMPNFDPNPPVLVSSKTASLEEKATGNTDAAHPEVGDTLLYTIQVQNTAVDSLIRNLVISDVLPEGLDYVPGSLTVDGKAMTDNQGDDQGYYVTGQVYGEFGDISDMNSHKLEFKAVIKSGQAGKDIQNTASIDGDNIDQPDKPTTTVNIYPREAMLESNKKSTIREKAAGNTNSAEPEVGDTLLYTIQTRNTITDSLVENLVISDSIPEGLEYVPGTLTLDGQAVSDGQDNDRGEYDNQKVIGRFEDVTDNDWHTLAFQVRIKAGQEGKVIRNVAMVSGDNIATPDEPEEVVTVYPNQSPIVPNFEESTWKNTTVTGSVYGVDPEGDPLTFTKGSDPQNGTVTINPDGTWTYVPNNDFTGTDSFTVTVSDGRGGTTTSTVTVNVIEPPNRPPVTENYDVTMEKDSSVTGSVYGTDPDLGDSLTYAIESNPKHGTLTMNPDGTWAYVPDNGYVGPDIFTVTVSDGKGGITTSTITINVTDKPNRPPTASDETVTTTKDTKVTGSVDASDPDGNPLTFTKGSDPQHGTVTVNPDGTWTYIPDPGYVGKDSFTVIVDDGKGGKTTVTITVNVTETGTNPGPGTNPGTNPGTDPGTNPGTTPDPGTTPNPANPNQVPSVPSYVTETPINTPVTGKVSGTDADGDSLTYTKGSDPEHGTVTVNPDGTWTYVPDQDYAGKDSFTVIVSDGRGGTTTSIVTVDVTKTGTGTTPDPVEPNQPPTSSDQSVTTPKNTPVTGKVSGSDANGDSLTYAKRSDPRHGTVTVNPDGTWTYVPDQDYTGQDSFTVTISDGRGGVETVTVTVNVTKSGEGGAGGNTVKPEKPTESTTLPTNDYDNDNEHGEQVKALGQGSGDNRLPNTSTNTYNLIIAGFIILCAGLVLTIRRKKA